MEYDDDNEPEFRCRKFGLGHKKPWLHVNAQCFKTSIYVGWRVFWIIAFLVMLGLDIYTNYTLFGCWFVYATNWTFTLQTLTVLIDGFVTIHVFTKRKDIHEGVFRQTTWYIKLFWLLFNVVNTASLSVTVLYFASLNPEFTFGSINFHIVNSVYTVLNIFFTAAPVQILHFYQPMIYSCFYVVFSITFHVLGNDPIYDPIDWGDVEGTAKIVVPSIIVGVPFVHTLLFAVYKFRVYVSQKCNCRHQSPRVRPIVY